MVSSPNQSLQRTRRKRRAAEGNVRRHVAEPPKSKFLQLFERDQGRCVYCGLDLKADYDRFMMATEDHLVPGSKGGLRKNSGILS